MKYYLLYSLLFFSAIRLTAQQAEREIAAANYHRYFMEAREVKDDAKEKAIRKLRQYFAENPYRGHSVNTCKVNWEYCIEQLTPDGQFRDMIEQEEKFHADQSFTQPWSEPQTQVGLFISEAFNRLWKIADAYRKGDLTAKKALTDSYLKAIIHYGNLEAGRPNASSRFHDSCFAIPTATVNIYYCFLKQMDECESGKSKNSLLNGAADMLKIISLHAWTQPFRDDETDDNIVQIERFRKHVWWVGGNALGYRSLLPVAVMYHSIPMLDLLADVCQKGISVTSQYTYDDAFWTEGFTVDGAGWGHGKQCLIWGYPIDGTSNALSILSILKGTPWTKNLTRENCDALLNYLRGSNWYYYKGFHLPCLDRSSMAYDVTPKPIRYSGMLTTIINNWLDSFTPQEQAELKHLQKEEKEYFINMSHRAPGEYSGTRWFFNNDDLIKKTPNYHMIVNMSSVRCDGLESAINFADEYNIYTTDGLTLFQKKGDEYRTIFGGWDITASPGVTAREGMDKITPATNWRGYCSLHNFAAAATNGGENAAAGFIFEKMNASDKEGVNDKGDTSKQNQVIYGVKAYKSWFMLGDYMIALGAGISNLEPGQEGTIRTTIDQTAYLHEVTLLQNGKEIPYKEGTQSMIQEGNPVWVIQKNKFAYTVLPEYTSNAWFTGETRPADWVKMNGANKNLKELPKEATVLQLWVDHGTTPVNDTYGYVVYAGRKTPPAELPFRVLQNDTTVQAITSQDGTVTGAVFYPGSMSLEVEGLQLSVSAPCALLIEKKGKETFLTVTDAQMNFDLKEIQVTLNGKKYQVEMPQGELCGKPATIQMK